MIVKSIQWSQEAIVVCIHTHMNQTVPKHLIGLGDVYDYLYQKDFENDERS